MTRLVKIGLTAFGQSFGGYLRVPDQFYDEEGKLDQKKLGAILSSNMLVSFPPVTPEQLREEVQRLVGG